MSMFIIVRTGGTLLMLLIGTRVSIAKQCDHKVYHVIALLNDGIAIIQQKSEVIKEDPGSLHTGQQRAKMWCMACIHQGQE